MKWTLRVYVSERVAEVVVVDGRRGNRFVEDLVEDRGLPFSGGGGFKHIGFVFAVGQ